MNLLYVPKCNICRPTGQWGIVEMAEWSKAATWGAIPLWKARVRTSISILSRKDVLVLHTLKEMYKVFTFCYFLLLCFPYSVPPDLTGDS